jgi:trans-L-3-hydroxyproline dehydratase
MQVRALDYHTAGEPLRIIRDGLPEIPGPDMLAKRRYMRDHLDHFRELLVLEPRGHADMYGAVLTEAVTEDGDVGVLFFHNEGYSTMCGHGIIAAVTAGIEHELFEYADPGAIRLDTPAGRITACASLNDSGAVASVSFRNVPSFVLHRKLEIAVEGLRIPCTIAFGGAFYAYVDAERFGLELVAAEAPRLIRLGREIKDAVSRRRVVRHPDGAEDLNYLYGTIFVRAGRKPRHSRNACVFAEGELARSPTGTGVSGRAAIHYDRGDIRLGEYLVIESFIGTEFQVRCIEETRVGPVSAVIPEVTGSAYICGEHRFIFDERDPLGYGFLVR